MADEITGGVNGKSDRIVVRMTSFISMGEHNSYAVLTEEVGQLDGDLEQVRRSFLIGDC